MPTGKERTVYFFNGAVVNQDDTAENWGSDSWENFIQLMHQQGTFQFTYNGLIYIAEAGVTSNHTQYLYVGKQRNQSDWPYGQTGSSGIVPISQASPDLSGVYEYAYLVHMRNTDRIAVLKSSGGPSPSAIARFISDKLRLFETGLRFEIRPILRSNQIQKLNDAEGATRISLKLESVEELSSLNGDSDLFETFKIANNVTNGFGSIELIISLGSARPSGPIARSLKDAFKGLWSRNPGVFKKAKATLINEGTNSRDEVDFIQDRITVKVSVGSSENEEPTAEAIISAISDAINRYITNSR